MINFKKLIRISLLPVLSIFLFLLIGNFPITYSKYESNINPNIKIGTAFYLFKSGYHTSNVKFDSLLPRNEEYVYQFTVSNYEGINRAETDLDYTITVTTTTNIPLEYKLFSGTNSSNRTNIFISDEIIQDDDGTYFKVMKTNTYTMRQNVNKLDTFRLVVVYPAIYSQQEYLDAIESIVISIDTKQIIDEV